MSDDSPGSLPRGRPRQRAKENLNSVFQLIKWQIEELQMILGPTIDVMKADEKLRFYSQKRRRHDVPVGSPSFQTPRKSLQRTLKDG